nr:hypothetical protein [uncultured Desulfobulbus sp.]
MKKYIHVLLLFLLFPVLCIAQDKGGQAGSSHQTITRGFEQAGVEAIAAEGLSRALLGAQFSENATRQIIAQFQLAQQDQQTLHVMTEKVHEGIAKQVNALAIARALTRVRARQTQARATTDTLAVGNPMRLRPVIADAMVSGLGKEDLDLVTQGLRSREKVLGTKQMAKLSMETMQTVRDMVRYGLDSNTASAVATSALAQGYSANDMYVLRQLIHNERLNTNMKVLGQCLIQGLREGVQAGAMLGYAQQGKVGGLSSKTGGRGETGSGGRGGSGGGHGGGH